MPEMDGFEVCQKMREMNIQQPSICASTASESTDESMMCLSLGIGSKYIKNRSLYC